MISIKLNGRGTIFNIRYPKYIKKMLNLSKNFHLVTTTRFNNISSLKDWPLWRVFLTNLRHKLLKFLLNLEFDASGAFRVIDSKKIKLKDILLSNQNGYSYFWESLYLLKKKKYKISEISIQLPYRKLGSSKMKIKDIIHAFYSLFLVYSFLHGVLQHQYFFQMHLLP